MEKVVIRKGERADVPRALELVRELAEYERAPHDVTNTVEEMLEDGFGARAVYRMWVAQKAKAIVGIAICYERYSTWKGRMLYLEDIVVTESERGQGIGHLLFTACRDFARDHGYHGMLWQVLDWNEPAIRFYKKYDAHFDPEWLNCKLTEEQLKNI